VSRVVEARSISFFGFRTSSLILDCFSSLLFSTRCRGYPEINEQGCRLQSPNSTAFDPSLPKARQGKSRQVGRWMGAFKHSTASSHAALRRALLRFIPTLPRSSSLHGESPQLTLSRARRLPPWPFGKEAFKQWGSRWMACKIRLEMRQQSKNGVRGGKLVGQTLGGPRLVAQRVLQTLTNTALTLPAPASKSIMSMHRYDVFTVGPLR
jgi:hypothetical protein